MDAVEHRARAEVPANMQPISLRSMRAPDPSLTPPPSPPRPRATSPAARYYAKRCILALIENLAKHMIVLKDGAFSEIMAFLGEAEKHGKDIKVSFSDGTKHQSRTIASEARTLKKMFLKLRD